MEGDRPAAELVEARHRVHHVTEEGVAALLAVGDDIDSRRGLELDRLVDRAVLDLLEARRTHLARLQPPPRRDQEVRP